MKKRTAALITGVVGGLVTAACAVLAYYIPEYASQFATAEGIIITAATELCMLFTVQE